MSASQVWLGNHAPSHLISSYIYMAVGDILAGTIKTINHISTVGGIQDLKQNIEISRTASLLFDTIL
jgi:hypothetical protein